MDPRRLRFGLALVVFALWVVSLGVMAVLSAREPPPQPIPRKTAR